MSGQILSLHIMDICNICKHYLLSIVLLCIINVSGTSQCVTDTLSTDAETCGTARYLCGYVMDGYQDRLSAAETPGIQPENFCGTSSAENIRWYTFSTCDTAVTIEIIHTGCTGGQLPIQGFQAGIYSSCDFDEDFLTCETSTAVNGTVLLSFTSPPGIHYLFVDGFAGSVCNYEIRIISGVDTTPIDSTAYIGTDISINSELDCSSIEGPNGTGDQTVCSLGQATFTTASLSPDFSTSALNNLLCTDSELPPSVEDQFMCLTWHIDPEVGYTLLSDTVYTIPYGNWDPKDYPLILEWEQIGTYDIWYTLQSNPNIPHCLGGGFTIDCQSAAITVEVTAPDLITLPADTICEGDTYIYCGQQFFESATLTCENIDSCQIETRQLVVTPRIEKQLGTQYICTDQCFEVYDTPYCLPGNYSVGGASNCDTFYLFTLVELDLEAEILGDTVITCTSTSAMLSAAIATNFPDSIQLTWTDPQNQPIPTDSDGSISVTQPGVYTLTVTPAGLEDCAVTVTTTISKDDAVPVLSAADQTITCSETSATLTVSSSEPIDTYQWSGPAGYSSTASAPSVTAAGTYTVVIIADNGCTAQTTLDILEDTTPPTTTLIYSDLDCDTRSEVASYDSPTAVSQIWTDPLGVSSTDSDLLYDLAGDYLLTLVAANGCQLDTALTVTDLSYTPTLGLPADTLWRCSTVQIAYPVSVPTDWTVTWTTTDGLASIVEESLVAMRPGTYLASISDTLLGCDAVDTLVIDLDTDTLAASFDILDPTCTSFADGSFGLEIQAGQPPFTIMLDGTMVEDTGLDVLAAGTYDLVISDAYGCTVSETITLTDPDPVVITSPEIVSVKYQPETELLIEHNQATANVGSIEWFDPQNTLLYEGNPYALQAASTPSLMYGILLTDVDGCTDSTAVTFEFDYSVDIHVPNIFSPNDDGVNDKWFVSSADFPFTLQQVNVYDRWGTSVYTARDITFSNEDEGWDGRLAGTACAAGVYVYTLTYVQADGKSRTQSGSITLIR